MDAIKFFLSYFPQEQAVLISSDQNDKIRIDVISSLNKNYFVVSEIEGDSIKPRILSEYPHIPFNLKLANQKPPASNELGVFVFVIDVHDLATKIRILFNQKVMDVDIVSKKACVFFWETRWVSRSNYLKILQLLVNGEWHDTFHPNFAATPLTFLKSYIEYFQTKNPDLDWAWDGNWADYKTPEERMITRKTIQLFVDNFEGSEPHMAVLAAGAVENSLSHEFLDYINADRINRKKWQKLIQGTYFHNEPEELQVRIKLFLAD